MLKAHVWVVALVASATMLAPPVRSQSSDDEARSALRGALDAAIEQAREQPDLDASYELLGVAGSSQDQNIPEIYTQAVKALNGLVATATASLTTASDQTLQDAIDQLVDLKILAAVNRVDDAQTALDKSLDQLFPVMTMRLLKVSSSDDWDRRFDALGNLTDIEAAAIQANLQAMVSSIDQAYGMAATKVQTDVNADKDPVTRAERLATLAEIATARDERLTDARANALPGVAIEMRNANDEGESDVSVMSDDATAPTETSCIEIATPSAASPSNVNREKLVSDCRLSGRTPLPGRCPTDDLGYVCYTTDAENEQITYVYRGTPEESYVRKNCGDDNILNAAQVPVQGAPFRTAGVSLAIACGVNTQSGD